VKPPLRGAADCQALVAGLLDGTVDAIVSQHRPHEIEFKNVEFEIASYGIIGLQTVLPIALEAGLSPELLAEKLAINPRKLLGLPVPELSAGEQANFVLFDTTTSWTLDSSTNRSRASNSPFFGKTLTGKIAAVFNHGQAVFF
jgi:dihydroorotase